MAKTRKSFSRKLKRIKKCTHKKHTRRSKCTHRKHRGGTVFVGADLNENLADSWPSRMSLGQGDHFKYRSAQTGGVADYPASIEHSTLEDTLRGPAHLNSLDGSFAYIKGMRDPPYDGVHMKLSGGRRTRRRRKRNKQTRRNKRNKRNRKTRGGKYGGEYSGEYATFPSQTMLLESQKQYIDAGLRKEWHSSPEVAASALRNTQ